MENTYSELLYNIGSTLQTSRENALKAINIELIVANWKIGRHIVDFEQHGKERAEYGSGLLVKLSGDLKLRFGKGFSRSSLQLMRLFYINYPKLRNLIDNDLIRQTASGFSLSWSHYAELLTVSDELARNFYEQQAINENWSFREMKRQIDSALFQRLALSKDKDGVLALVEKGQIIKNSNDLIKDPYIFEFLNIPKKDIIKESDLDMQPVVYQTKLSFQNINFIYQTKSF